MTRRPHAFTTAAALVAGTVLLGAAPVGTAAAGPARRPRPPGCTWCCSTPPPAAAYDGRVHGLRATRPAGGHRFDRTRPAVSAYAAWLTRRQDDLLAKAGDPDVLYRFTTAVDGFAATLTGDQVQTLRADPRVLRVERSTKQHLDRTRAVPAVGSSSRELLGLDGPGGAWARHGGVERAGRGVVIGVVDSGLWPESPSFNGVADATPGTAASLPGFHGDCAVGERWTREDCSDKVVSARWFVHGFGAENTAGAEYLSPRDGTGHGSHVASTAAGDHGVRVQVDGQRFGTTSGMAPAARLAVYKACWTAPGPGRRRLHDGGHRRRRRPGGRRRRRRPQLLGVRQPRARRRGRAGLPRRRLRRGLRRHLRGQRRRPARQVAHVAPWVTTVAASTHHVFQGAVRLGDGRSYVGAMVADRGGPLGRPGARRRRRRPRRRPPTRPGSAPPASLDAPAAEGTIVVCERGGGARRRQVRLGRDGRRRRHGPGEHPPREHRRRRARRPHRAPGRAAEAAAVEAYARRPATAPRSRSTPRAHGAGRVPAVAGFSARGPALASGGDVLKPDLTAPGVSVLGAVAPPSDSGRSWDLASGTSTSAPHVAGLAAVRAGVHPGWSPSRVSSAMMTTAYDVAGVHGPLAEGAGHVDAGPVPRPRPGASTPPPTAWRDLLARRVRRPRRERPVGRGRRPGRSHHGDPPAHQRRTGSAESYAVRKRGLRGVDVQAFPATVRLAPGQSRTVRLRITARPTATVDRDVTGWLVWRGDRHRVRIPVSVRPTVVAAPRAGRRRPGDSGSRVVVRGRSGNGRTVKLHSTGLVAARTSALALRPGTFDPTQPRADADTAARQVRIPAGTAVARFAASGRRPAPSSTCTSTATAGSWTAPPATRPARW